VTRTERCPGRGRHRGSDGDRGRSGTNDSAPARERAPIARAVGLAPAAGRVLWAWIVTHCPFGCGGAHLHRGGVAGGVRRAGCGRGEYQVTAGRRWPR
jgi:hypothetical protein